MNRPRDGVLAVPNHDKQVAFELTVVLEHRLPRDVQGIIESYSQLLLFRFSNARDDQLYRLFVPGYTRSSWTEVDPRNRECSCFTSLHRRHCRVSDADCIAIAMFCQGDGELDRTLQLLTPSEHAHETVRIGVLRYLCTPT